MKPKQRSRTGCLFCCKSCPASTPFPNGEILGAVKCSELEKQLRNLFILRQLLNIPSSWCEAALARRDGVSNPDSWFRICSGCMNIVTEGWCIYQKLLDLEGKMRSIKERVKNVVHGSVQLRNGRAVGGIDNEIRKLAFPEFEHSCATETMDIKCESKDSGEVILPHESPWGPDFNNESLVSQEPPLSSDSDEYFGTVRSKAKGRKKWKTHSLLSKPSKRKARTKSRRRAISSKPRIRPKQQPLYKHKCDLCPSKFKTQEDYYSHMNSHEESKHNGGKFDCETCSFPGKDEADLKEHISLKHTDARKLFPMHYNCKMCDFVGDSMATMRAHVQEKHPDVPPDVIGDDEAQTCPVCVKEFASLRSLVNHQRRMHPELFGVEQETIHCDQCEMLFSNKLHLRYHINNIHMRVNLYICDVCGTGFQKRAKLERHKISHKGKKEYVCDVCGLDYAYQSVLDGHHKKFHSKPPDPNAEPFKCKYCDLTSPYKPVIKRHMETHKVEMGIQCDICQKYYTNVNGLKLHKQINHSETNEQFVCPYCLKPFPALPNLKTHIARYCKLKGLTNDNNVKPISILYTTADSTSVMESVEIDPNPVLIKFDI